MASARRPWVAAVLAVVQPGFGHVYLREWFRALLWFGLWVWTVVLVVPVSPTDSIGAVTEAFAALSLPAAAALASVVVFGTLDAYRLALRADTPDDGPSCPCCGREVDPSLGFCHWCTERLDGTGNGDGTSGA